MKGRGDMQKARMICEWQQWYVKEKIDMQKAGSSYGRQKQHAKVKNHIRKARVIHRVIHKGRRIHYATDRIIMWKAGPTGEKQEWYAKGNDDMQKAKWYVKGRTDMRKAVAKTKGLLSEYDPMWYLSQCASINACCSSNLLITKCNNKLKDALKSMSELRNKDNEVKILLKIIKSTASMWN